MDITEKIEEIQHSDIIHSHNPILNENRTTINSSSLEDIAGVLQFPSDSSGFINGRIIGSPEAISALEAEPIAHDWTIDANTISATGTIRRYVQLTEEDYDTMLERISSLEERLTALERRL